eukprot:gb/GECG01012978.1/.p1 GENE.gb/GECG01012978.1/~~gb/GECG01012978.1/.p1  ORF type:complete len:740 (+),score=108.84 gb/GECG01012978.1/:1-2220(+)
MAQPARRNVSFGADEEEEYDLNNNSGFVSHQSVAFSPQRGQDYQRITSSTWPTVNGNILPVKRKAVDYSEDSDICGTLGKVGKWRGKPARYFVVKPATVLLYYKDKEDMEPEGCVIVDDMRATSAYDDEAESGKSEGSRKEQRQAHKKKSTIVLSPALVSQKQVEEDDEEKSQTKKVKKFVLRAQDEQTAEKWIGAFNAAVGQKRRRRRSSMKKSGGLSRFGKAVQEKMHQMKKQKAGLGGLGGDVSDEKYNKLLSKYKELVGSYKELALQQSKLIKVVKVTKILKDVMWEANSAMRSIFRELGVPLSSIDEDRVHILRQILPQDLAMKCTELISSCQYLRRLLGDKQFIRHFIQRYMTKVADDNTTGVIPSSGSLHFTRFLSHLILGDGYQEDSLVDLAKEVVDNPTVAKDMRASVQSILASWAALFPSSAGSLLRSLGDSVDVWDYASVTGKDEEYELSHSVLHASSKQHNQLEKDSQFYKKVLEYRKSSSRREGYEPMNSSGVAAQNLVSAFATAVLLHDEHPDYPLETALRDYLALYDPAKVRKVPRILEHFEHDETKLVAHLERKYRRPFRVPYLPLSRLPFAPGVLLRPHWSAHHWAQFNDLYQGDPDNFEKEGSLDDEEDDDDDESVTLDFGDGVRLDLDLTHEDQDSSLDSAKVDTVPGVPNYGDQEEWVPNDSVNRCSVCCQEFSVSSRKHHCRACGRVVCHDCSKHEVPLPEFGYWHKVRQCDDCVKLL